jgi:hypothetical protein
MIAVVVCCILSVLPAVQTRNPRASLLTSAVVCLYAMYLISSALFSEPLDCVDKLGVHLSCNATTPTTPSCSYQQSSHSEAFRLKHFCVCLFRWLTFAFVDRIASVVIGAMITFVAVAFSSMRAGSHAGSAPMSESSSLINGSKDGDSSSDDEKKSPEERALEKQDRELLNLDNVPHNEAAFEPCAYNYVWFHAVMGLGSMYIGSLLSNWSIGAQSLSIDNWSVDKSMVTLLREKKEILFVQILNRF